MTSKWRVPYVDLAARYAAMQPELGKAIDDVFKSGRFVGGEIVERFEREMATYLGVKYVVGVGNGYDALYLSLRAAGIGRGDEVITVSHTFVATLAAIKHCDAIPVLIDIWPDGNMNESQIEDAITEHTMAILPVHMNGWACVMGEIMRIAKENNLIIIEDAAQAIGAEWLTKKAGTFGLAGCFSMHPLKTLSVAGDGGFVATNDPTIDYSLRLLRNHGQDKYGIAGFGVNSRLDALQACIGLLGLSRLESDIAKRHDLARKYVKAFKGLDIGCQWATSQDAPSSFVIRTAKRDALRAHLSDMGIETMVHWPVPLHKHPSLRLEQRHPLPETECLSAECLSLPIYPEMTDTQQEYVVDCVKRFYGR